VAMAKGIRNAYRILVWKSFEKVYLEENETDGRLILSWILGI
jgi:hypothetical protein